MEKKVSHELPRRMPVMQSDMFGQSKPVFEGCPNMFHDIASRIYWLWDNGRDQQIADDDYYLQVKYWITYEGLGKVLGEDALMRFAEWFIDTKPVPPETLRRGRQWLTSEASGELPYMPQSPEVKRRRRAKQGMIEAQIRGD